MFDATEWRQTARQNVARGVALLDEKLPGWEQNIVRGRFDIRHMTDCVVGQQPGGWYRTLDRLDVNGSETAALGFGMLERAVPYVYRRAAWAILQDEWERVLDERPKPKRGLRTWVRGWLRGRR